MIPDSVQISMPVHRALKPRPPGEYYALTQRHMKSFAAKAVRSPKYEKRPKEALSSTISEATIDIEDLEEVLPTEKTKPATEYNDSLSKFGMMESNKPQS